jgi:hypothetical protein
MSQLLAHLLVSLHTVHAGSPSPTQSTTPVRGTHADCGSTRNQGSQKLPIVRTTSSGRGGSCCFSSPNCAPS